MCKNTEHCLLPEPLKTELDEMQGINKLKLLRQSRKLKGVKKGNLKALRFFKMVFNNELPSRSNKTFRKYKGIFTKTRDGRFFNKDLDWNNERISRINKYIWRTEMMEMGDICRVFVKSVRGLR